MSLATRRQSGGNKLQKSLTTFRHSIPEKRDNFVSKNKENSKSEQVLPHVIPTSQSVLMSSYMFYRALEELDSYTIKIISNWGNQNLTTCSIIWFLDDRKMFIDPNKIKSIPVDNKDNLSKLIDRCLIKTEKKNMWHCKKSNDFNQIELTYFFPIIENPKYIRIWNSPKSGDTGIKYVEVYHDEELVSAGEIPINYGADLSILEKINKTLSLKEFRLPSTLYRISVDKNIELSDPFGKCPVEFTKRLTFKILKSYGNKLYIAINNIAIYDERDNRIEFSEIEEVFVQNAISFKNAALLFKPDACTNNEKDMFLMKVDWKKPPLITVVLKNPTIIKRVVFWNNNSYEIGFDAGVDHMSVISNSNHVWTGKVKIGSGSAANADYSATTILINTLPVDEDDIDAISEKELSYM